VILRPSNRSTLGSPKALPYHLFFSSYTSPPFTPSPFPEASPCPMLMTALLPKPRPSTVPTPGSYTMPGSSYKVLPTPFIFHSPSLKPSLCIGAPHVIEAQNTSPLSPLTITFFSPLTTLNGYGFGFPPLSPPTITSNKGSRKPVRHSDTYNHYLAQAQASPAYNARRLAQAVIFPTCNAGRVV
jgi:hypothetical protein